MDKKPRRAAAADAAKQHEAFVAAAREHGCDEDLKTFDDKLRKMLVPKKRRPKAAGKAK